MPKEKEKNIADKNINETPATTDNIETAGDRLLKIINKFFTTQIKFAYLSGMNDGSLSSYLSGRYNISKKIAYKLQDVVGVNSYYLLNGNLPMMADETRKPILEGNVPYISKTDTKTLHGITKLYTLEYKGK